MQLFAFSIPAMLNSPSLLILAKKNELSLLKLPHIPQHFKSACVCVCMGRERDCSNYTVNILENNSWPYKLWLNNIYTLYCDAHVNHLDNLFKKWRCWSRFWFSGVGPSICIFNKFASCFWYIPKLRITSVKNLQKHECFMCLIITSQPNEMIVFNV